MSQIGEFNSTTHYDRAENRNSGNDVNLYHRSATPTYNTPNLSRNDGFAANG